MGRLHADLQAACREGEKGGGGGGGLGLLVMGSIGCTRSLRWLSCTSFTNMIIVSRNMLGKDGDIDILRNLCPYAYCQWASLGKM